MKKQGLKIVLVAVAIMSYSVISCGLKDGDVFGIGNSSGASSSSGSGGSSGASSSSGSGGNTGGSGGSIGGGGSGGCEADQKDCGGECVSKASQSYGCAGETCEPCDLEHAAAKCSVEGACVVDYCDGENFDDCDHDGLSCETDLNTDLDNCGECDNACSSTVTDGECVQGKCFGPCGEIVQTGWSICYELDHSAYPNDYVGLAGGVVAPGESLSIKWLDPWYGCVSTDSSLNYMTCAQGSLTSGTFFQFRAGIHDEPTYGTMIGTWACNTSDCQGRCFIYKDGTEVGKLVDGLVSGELKAIYHYQAPVYYDLIVTVP